ncbi:MAG: hypothetical protein KGJ68_05320 [Gammaproteobacteria bacterium]|nr:hypothetical protein [Gammaproteobacteria bacterium]
MAVFTGSVHCRRTPDAPLGLTLSGCTAAHPGAPLELAFAGVAPADLPERLEDARVEAAAPGEYRIAAGAREWRVTARAVHAHYDAGAAFYRALPGRPAPLVRRALYRALLALARTPFGLALLRAVRR